MPKNQSITIKIGKRKIASVDGIRVHSQLKGAMLSNLSPEDEQNNIKHGIKVIEINVNSKAWVNGLRKGDVIARANRIQTRNIIELINAAKKRKSLLLNVQRGNSAFFLIIR